MYCSHCGAENKIPNARICITCQEPLPHNSSPQTPIFKGSSKPPGSEKTNFRKLFVSQAHPEPPTQVSTIQSIAFGPAPPSPNPKNLQRPRVSPSSLSQSAPPVANPQSVPASPSPQPITSNSVSPPVAAQGRDPVGPFNIQMGGISPVLLYVTAIMFGIAIIFFIFDLYILIQHT